MNNKFLPSKEVLSEVLNIKKIHKVEYSTKFINIDLGVKCIYTNPEDGYPEEEYCIDVCHLMGRCREYLLTNKGINIITEKNNNIWTAIAVPRGEITNGFAYTPELEIKEHVQAPTEYEAVFKIADILLLNN